MKKIVGICMLAATSGLASLSLPVHAAGTEAGVSRWSAPALDRHLPLERARTQRQQPDPGSFRYMDGATVKRSKGLHNAVLTIGRQRPAAAAAAVPSAPVHRHRDAQPRARVIMQPMT